MLNKLKRYWQKFSSALFYYQWNIGIIDRPIQIFVQPNVRPKVAWLPGPPPNQFIADPFAICQFGIMHLLYEDYNYRTEKGCISAMTMRPGQKPIIYQDVIKTPFHMSYPYLIEHNDQIYCVPEISESGQVRLYRAIKFPHQWEELVVLIENFAGVDSTIFKHNGHWWLLATDNNDDDCNHLKAWFAPDLLGPWQQHPANPIKTSRRSSRPAGTPFVADGCLYRPAQDCSEIYGGRVVVNRVLKLSPTEFKEEEVVVINPYSDGPYQFGLHTISRTGNLTLIDGRRRVFIAKNIWVMINRLKQLMKLLAGSLNRLRGKKQIR